MASAPTPPPLPLADDEEAMTCKSPSGWSRFGVFVVALAMINVLPSLFTQKCDGPDGIFQFSKLCFGGDATASNAGWLRGALYVLFLGFAVMALIALSTPTCKSRK